MYQVKTIDDYHRQITEYVEILEASPFFCDLEEQGLNNIEKKTKSLTEIRCLALGSPTEADNPRYQLALLLLLKKKFNIERITAWDPEFTEKDNDLLKSFDIQVVEVLDLPNDDKIWQSYLWYLPHAPLSLTESFLRKILENELTFTVIGNDIMSYDTSSIDVESKYPSVFRSIKELSSDQWFTYTMKKELSKNQPYFEAFNEMSVQKRKASSKINLN